MMRLMLSRWQSAAVRSTILVDMTPPTATITPYGHVPSAPAVVRRWRTEAGPTGAVMHEDTWYRFDGMDGEREFEDYDEEDEDPEKKKEGEEDEEVEVEPVVEDDQLL